MEKEATYRYRFISRVVMEADTPLALGCGEGDIITDSLVAKDVNGLPYIPGSSIAGVVRHMIGDAEASRFMGFQKDDKGHGSNVIFSDARMVGHDGKVVDSLVKVDWNNPFYAHYNALPIREHVRIGHRGSAEKSGKFDEQVVFKGTRFCFEIEMLSKSRDDVEDFNTVIDKIRAKDFTLGSGTRSGFGRMKVIEIRTKELDLASDDKTDLEAYIEKSSSLASEWPWQSDDISSDGSLQGVKYREYELKIAPADSFIFAAGYGDDKSDMAPVRESIVKWNCGKPEFVDNCILIPASSFKGALSHRTAYHYNRLTGVFANKLADAGDTVANHVGKNNLAVLTLFGSEGKKKEGTSKVEGKKRGQVIFSDIVEERRDMKDMLQNHVRIDSLTGGAADGALFGEKVVYGAGGGFSFKALVPEKLSGIEDEKVVIDAFEEALKDVCRGYLPLGGGASRGHGTFTGELYRNGEKISQK